MAEINDGAPQTELGKDDILDILNVEDEEVKEEIKEEEEVKEEEKEEVEEEDDLKELEDELKEPSEDDLELMTPVRRQEILKEFPDLFKKFPYLEKAYYREQRYTEIFPTIPDAEAAKEKAETMDNFQTKILEGGDIGVVLKAIQDEGGEAFNRVVDNYLPALMQANEPAYYHVIGNVIKNTIISMVQESQEMGEEGAPLKAAANIINQFVFGTQKFTSPSKLSKEIAKNNDKEKEIKAREDAFVQQQFDNARDDLQTRIDNTLKATIDNNIDTKKSMTDYVRRNASRDAFDSLESLLKQDTRFASILDKLWERAFENKFNRESLDKIKSAYLSRAKTLLPTVIKKARNEALKGSGKREESSPRKGPIPPGRSTSQPSGKGKSEEIPKGMSTKDFFMQD